MSREPKRVVIVGIGGIGSWLASAIGKALEFQAPGSILILVDGDNFEEKNVERQIFKDLGNKAQVLRNDIQPSLPSTFVVARPAWVVPEESLEQEQEEEDAGKITPNELLEENDYVFAVVDNFAARKLLLDGARNFDNIDVFIGGNDDALYGTVGHYRRRDGQDITEHPGVRHDEFVNPPDKNPGELSCAERAQLDGGTQLLAINLGVTAQLVAKASYVLFGSEDQIAMAIRNTEVHFDLGENVMEPYDRRTEHGVSLEKDNKQHAIA